MTRQNISIGSSANDGTGDTLRAAGTKINDTLVEIYNKFGPDSNNLSSQISLEDSAVVFEGATADAHETRLMAENATADRLVRIPNASGTLVMDTLTQTITNKTIGRLSFSTDSASTDASVIDSDATLIICNNSGAFRIYLRDGSTAGEYKIFTNKGAGAVTVDPDNFRGADSDFTLEQNEGTQCIWDGTKWFIIGNESKLTIA